MGSPVAIYPVGYEGLEIDMLSVGDADSILVTRWHSGIATRVLIDGGSAGCSDTVRAFLRQHGVIEIHHIVCSHGHDDHASGLISLVQDRTLNIGHTWMHVPRGEAG
jgi:beta-lactamase superfamily II metal-dependent hydrolase